MDARRFVSSSHTSSESSRGATLAAIGFITWGLSPLYWTELRAVAATEIIAHRIVWSLLFLLGVLFFQKNLRSLRAGFATLGAIAINFIAGLLLTANWTAYIWGVNHGMIIECSLGYFLTPLCNVALGFFVLKERPRPLQWGAIICAAIGVGILLFKLGHFPWLALLIASSFAVYGLLKKQSPLKSITGLTAETLLMFPFALAVLVWCHHTGDGALGRADLRTHGFIFGTGIFTAIPLVMFAYGAQRVRLTSLGLLQYLAPTVQFLLGLFVYHEAFDHERLQAFAIIWFGLVLYTADSFWDQRRTLFDALRRSDTRRG
jgi:chloramphenicol-sensitive protein RarD